ncbi:MAG: 50S ribosomal protein L20, partial [Streptococcus sp.]|nr:50S ribosomal protein L20 [Streptococcus sp.]
MARVKGGVVSRKRRKRVLKLAKGYYGAKHILFRTAKEQRKKQSVVTVKEVRLSP